MNNDKKQVWYVAGPMSNLPGLNFAAFHAEAARLRALGHEVINPAEINGGADELAACAAMTPAEMAEHWRACMRNDIKVLVDCDGISLLPGWERSRGARLELHVASELGLDVIEAPGVSPWPQPEPSIGAAPDWAAA